MFFGAKISGLEAFEGLDKEGILLEVITRKLTQTLGRDPYPCSGSVLADRRFPTGQLTIPLSRETATLMKDYLPESDGRRPLSIAGMVPG